MIRHELPPRGSDGSQAEIQTVLGPEGRADPAFDPRIDQALVVRIYKAMLRTRLLESQQSRRLVVRALGTGALTTWDHHVPDDGPDRYISSGRDFWGSLEQARLPDGDQG